MMAGGCLACKVLCRIVFFSSFGDVRELQKSTFMSLRPCLSHHSGRQRQLPMQAVVPAYLILSRVFIPVGPNNPLLTYCTCMRLLIAQTADALEPRFVTSL